MNANSRLSRLKKRYLGRYKEARYAELCLLEEYDRIRHTAAPAGMTYDGAGSGRRSPDGLDSYAVRCEKVREKLRESSERWQRVREEIEDCIAEVRDENERIVLWQRYINLDEIQSGGKTVGYRFRSLKDIASAMHYSEGRVQHWHSDGLKHLNIPAGFNSF